MPGVVAFVGAGLLGAIGIGAASAGVIMAVGATAIALTVASVRRASQLKDPAEIQRISAIQVSVRSTEAPRNIVFGEALVGGVVTYVNTTGTENRSLYYEIVHTGHEIDSFIGWYLDDKYIPIADVDGINGEGIGGGSNDGRVGANSGAHGLDPYSSTPVLYLRGHLGTDSQAVDGMLDTAFADIGTNHRHRGCAKTVVRCELVQGGESKWNGRPPQSITAVVRGAKCYDPRLDSTFPGGSGAHRLATPSTWAWTDNPALIYGRYRSMARPLGPEWGTDRVGWQAVFDAANVCDASVAIPTSTTEKRFRCDLVVDAGMEPSEVIDKILATMGGKERYYNGQWHVFAAGWPSTDFALTDDDAIDEIQYRKQPDEEDRYNQVKPSFIDRARLWKTLPAIAVNNTTLRTNRDNGEVLTKDLRLDGVTREYQAQRLGKFELNQADDTGILVFPTGYNALNIRVGDTGTVTLSELGFSAKTFRCVHIRHIDFVGDVLTLKEDASGNYSDPAEGEYSTRTAAGDITFGSVMPWYLASPPGIWSITCTFSATDADTVAWGSGSLILVNGTTYSISAGNTGNMSARTYIYFDPAASATVLQTTTTAATAVGARKVLLGIAENSSTGPMAFFQIFGGGGGILSRTSELSPEAATEVYQYEDFGTDTGDPVTDQVDDVVIDVDSIVYVEARCNSCGAGGADVGTWTPFVGGDDGYPITTDDGTTVVNFPVVFQSFLVSPGTYDIGVRADSSGAGTMAVNDVVMTITVVKR